MNASDRSRTQRSLFFYALSTVFFVVLGAFLIWSLRALILPLILGCFLAYIFRPLMSSFKHPMIPDELRIGALLGGLCFGLYLLAGAVIGNIPNENEKLELQVRIQYKFNMKYRQIMALDKESGKGNWLYQTVSNETNPMMDKINQYLSLDEEGKDKFLRNNRTSSSPNKDKYKQYFVANQKQTPYLKVETRESASETNPVDAPASVDGEKAGSDAAKVIDMLAVWILLPFSFLFLLFDNGHATKYFVKIVPNRYFELTVTVFEEVDNALGRYLRGTAMECSLVGATFILGLFLLGLDFKISLLIGAVAGITNAIPFLGPMIGLVYGLFYALITEDVHPLIPGLTNDDLFLGVVVLVVIVHLLDNAIYAPVVLGGAVNLHPLVVILGVTGGSILFGVPGMLFAIPTIVVSRVIVGTLLEN